MRMCRNPAIRPTLPVVYSYETLYANWVHIVDRSEHVAGMKFHAFDDHVHISYSAAKEGYGPLLYQTVATILNVPLTPSDSLSYEAVQFWERNNNVILPLTSQEYLDKWGFALVVSPAGDMRLFENNVIMYGGFKSMYDQLKFPCDAEGRTVEQQVDSAEREKRRYIQQSGRV